MSSGSPKVTIHTHGCKLNQADSQVLARQFQASGFTMVRSASQADVIVLNSCTVTANSDSKARQYLRRARRTNPGALVVATGCYAQRSKGDLSAMEAVSLVLDNRDKPTLVSIIADELNVSFKTHKEIPTAPAYARSRSMIKIQEGCDQICAYCIVPKVRGRERSIPPNEIISQINGRSESGCQEVVLTGTQLGTYGFDLPGVTLAGLLQRILAETDINRFRVSSLQAHEITPDLLELWDDLRLCPHFHIPLQSGSDTILKSMRRRYNTDRFKESVKLVRKTIPDAGITTDIIIGFPGEGVKEFAESYDFAAAMRFSDMHVFPYSVRPGTSAAYLDNRVADTKKKERTREMLELATVAMREFRQESIGQVRPVLWETAERSKPGHVWSGLTDNYLRVTSNVDLELSNTLTNTRLTGLDGDWMIGEMILN